MNEMNVYANMKDSGIDWIGNIPSHWAIHTLYQLVSQVKNKNKDLAEKNLLSLSYGKIKRKSIETTEGLLPESFDGYNIIDAGDVVLRLTDLQNDHTSLRVGLATERGIITSAYTTLHPSENCVSKYMYYLLHSFDIRKGFYGMGSGVRQGLNYDEVKELRIALPHYDEQEAIVAYLDKQCALIDDAVVEARKSINEYKEWKSSIIFTAVTKGLNANVSMKESNNEWLGKIPSVWQVKRFSLVNYIRARLGWKGLKAEEYVEKGYPFLSAFNIEDSKLDWSHLNFITKERYDESPEIKLTVGDIVLVKDGAGIGKCARLDKLPLGEATVNSSLAVITPQDGIDYRYEYYYLLSPLFTNVISRLKNGMGVPHLTQEAMKEIYIPIPPLEEQRAIAAYLDAKIEILNGVVRAKTLLISDLESYRRSLIFETVTGKRKVVQ